MAKFSVYKHVFDLPDRYAEGHAVTAAEAAVLNQQMAELLSHRIRNGAFEAVTVGTAPTPEQVAEAEKFLAEEAGKFEFGSTRGSGTPRIVLDPVGKEAKRIADALVRKALVKAGKILLKKEAEATDASHYTYEQFQAKVAETAARPEVIADAQRIVKLQSKNEMTLEL